MAVDYSIISIGTLSHNRLWDEKVAKRTAHSTVTMVTDGDRLILVDPSLPGKFLESRFDERTGKSLEAVTDVFCTTLRPVHRRGLDALQHANWWCYEPELEAYQRYLEEVQETAERLSSEDEATIKGDMDVIRKFMPAPDRFSDQIHLYPLVGASVGSCGLLLTPATNTVLIAGDAVVTKQHYLSGQIWEGCVDQEAAKKSFEDVVEIADIIIPGHDNILLSARNWL